MGATLTDEEARERATRWYTPDPDVPYPGASRPWPGTCPSGHAIAPRLSRLAAGARVPCRACSSAARKLSDADARELAAPHYIPDPSTPFPGSKARWPGTCLEGHPCAPLLGRVLSGAEGPCPTCANTARAASLRLTDEEARRRAAAHYTPDPGAPFPGVDAPWPGTCFQGHACAPRLSALAGGQGACAECAHRSQLTEPEARGLALDAGFQPYPDAPYSGRHVPWPGTCPQGHRVSPTLGQVLKKGRTPCYACAGQPRRSDGEARELAAKHYTPSPDIPFPGVMAPWLGVCFEGHPTAPTLANLLAGHGPCRICSGSAKLTDSDARDLARRWFTPDPEAPYPGSNRPWPGTCPQGHEVAPRLGSLVHRGQGPCRTCTGKAKRTDAQARRDASSFYTPDPHVPYPGALTPWPGTCPRGHRIQPRLNTLLTRPDGGCAGCAVHGYNPARPGWLYLREDPDTGRQKIGITNREEAATSSRQHELRARGGVATLIDAVRFKDGQDAFVAEQTLLAGMDLAGIPRGRRAWGEGNRLFDGYTETWPVESMGGRVATIAELARRLDVSLPALESTTAGRVTGE